MGDLPEHSRVPRDLATLTLDRLAVLDDSLRRLGALDKSLGEVQQVIDGLGGAPTRSAAWPTACRAGAASAAR